MNGYDARTHLTRWLGKVASRSDYFQAALRTLCHAGCDRLQIAWLLNALAYASAADPLSRDDVRGIARSVEEAARRVLRLQRSQLDLMLSVELDLELLQAQLGQLATRLHALEATAHPRQPMSRNIVRAALVYYVRDKTRKYHDDHVSVLIDVTESLNGNDAGAYSAEAHTQWRNRPAARRLLDELTDEIGHLFDRMDADLAG